MICYGTLKYSVNNVLGLSNQEHDVNKKMNCL